MFKTVKFKTNNFPAIPPSLASSEGKVKTEIQVDLASLYHHYYIDSRGFAPPDPNPTHFEHVRYLASCPEFRFQRNGLGVNKTFKGNKSNELGQAFCRWFLSEHLGINYIAHIDEVRKHNALSNFGGVSVEINSQITGDAPDYFCATSTNAISLAEAKGTMNSVGFKTKKFQTWRDQFKRIIVKDGMGSTLRVKGYIVATRWAMEDDSSKIYTTLSAEDPETDGIRSIGDESGRGLALATKSIHYVATLERLRQPLMAAVLSRGVTIPPELRITGIIWQCMLPGFEHLRFVGGYFPGADGLRLPFSISHDGRLVDTTPDPLRLDVSSGTFIGIEKNVFHILAEAARIGSDYLDQLRTSPGADGYYSGMSYLSDGHIIGPIELFQPIEPFNI